MKRNTTVHAGARSPKCFAVWLQVGLLAALVSSSDVVSAQSSRIPCTQSALLAAVSAANAAGGGTITFNCTGITIPMTASLDIQDNVVIDGEARNITLEYTTNFAGCATADNGIDGPAIGHLSGHNSVVRNLTFKYFLESLQIIGPNNTVEGNVFLGHSCSDDAVSTIRPTALNAVIRNNRVQSYKDKAFQISLGSGTIEGNTFIDAAQPIRGAYDNTQGGVFVIRSNVIKTTGDRSACALINFDGTYQIVFENNTLQCLRGLHVSGLTQAIVRNNIIEGNPRQGILIGGSAVVSLSGNTITNNGLSPGSEPAGGVVVWQNGRVDLGGGSLTINGQVVSSPGGNRLQTNGVADVRNLRTAYTFKAETNCWDHQVVATIISQDRQGDVDVDPFAQVCEASATAPQSPGSLRLLR